jgi:hypothetical protein
MPVEAQSDEDEKFENFKSRRIAYITEQVKLTPKEAEVFWPVYNEFDSKRQALNKERVKTARYYVTVKENISEKEASELADKVISLQKKEALLSEEYNSKFKAVLPSSKVLRLYQAELQFKRQLLKQLKESNPKPGDKLRRFNKE